MCRWAPGWTGGFQQPDFREPGSLSPTHRALIGTIPGEHKLSVFQRFARDSELLEFAHLFAVYNRIHSLPVNSQERLSVSRRTHDIAGLRIESFIDYAAGPHRGLPGQARSALSFVPPPVCRTRRRLHVALLHMRR